MPARRGRGAARGLGIGLVLVLSGALAAEPPGQADRKLASVDASIDVERVAQTVLDTHDNQRLPYLIIDKANARVFVFDAAGRLTGSAAVLLGLARGDQSAGDIGTRPLAAIDPSERVTPAGRFLAHLDYDARGEQVLLVDYEASIALHPVAVGKVDERRAERLASATAQDNRISFGCINVSPAFYAGVVVPAFARTRGYVYILPETRGWQSLFVAPPAR